MRSLDRSMRQQLVRSRLAPVWQCGVTTGTHCIIIQDVLSINENIWGSYLSCVQSDNIPTEALDFIDLRLKRYQIPVVIGFHHGHTDLIFSDSSSENAIENARNVTVTATGPWNCSLLVWKADNSTIANAGINRLEFGHPGIAVVV